jgi:hypothetical protein
MQYRYSPIQDVEQLKEVVNYIARQTTALCNETIGTTLPIRSLTVFSHFPEEYEELVRILHRLGDLHNENNGPRVRLHAPIVVDGNTIEFLRIRKPGVERPQVGCNDFETDYSTFKATYLTTHADRLTLIRRPKYEMIEFSHPSFDVLAYVVE